MSDVFSILAIGFVTFSATIVGVHLTHKAEVERQIKRERRKDVAQTFSGLQKLISTYEFVENTARHIENEFKNSEISETADAASIVRPIIGAEAEIPLLSADEFAFLVGSDGRLRAKISELQMRARNDAAVVKLYNLMKAEYDSFSDGHIVGVDGSSAVVEFEGVSALVAKKQIGRLNVLLASLIDALEDDRLAARNVIDEYISESRKAFPSEFENIRFLGDARSC